jgi:hypothetical protein
MGIADFQLLKKNLIEVMKLETEKIPTQNNMKPSLQGKIAAIENALKKDERLLKSIENKITSLEDTTPNTDIEIKILMEKLDEKKSRDLSEQGSLPPKETKHHIIVALIGGLVYTFMAFLSRDDTALMITFLIAAPLCGYIAIFLWWYTGGFVLEIVGAVVFGTRDKSGGVDEFDIVLAWPPYHITRRTRAAYERAYSARKEIKEIKKRYKKDVNDLENSAADALRKNITKSKKELNVAEGRFSKNIKDLEKANEELNDLETYVNTLEIKKKELLDSVAYLIPFSSELS